MTRDEDALRMMAEVRAAGDALSKRAKAPVWYHPVLGLLMGGLVALQGQAAPVMIAGYAVSLTGVALLAWAYKRHTGMWINGYRAGRTRWVAVGLAAITTLCTVIAVWLQRERGLAFAPPVFGALVAAIVTVGGFVWQAAFRADLRDGGAL